MARYLLIVFNIFKVFKRNFGLETNKVYRSLDHEYLQRFERCLIPGMMIFKVFKVQKTLWKFLFQFSGFRLNYRKFAVNQITEEFIELRNRIIITSKW